MNRSTLLIAAALSAALIAVFTGVTRGADAATGTVGAKAYARVISNGTFDANRSRNITSIALDGTGVYCIDVAVRVKNVVASVNAVSAPATAEAGLVGGSLDSGISCPAGSTVYVRTFALTSTGPVAADVPFYIVMH